MNVSPQDWDVAAFRDTVQHTLDVFVDRQDRRFAPLGEDAVRLVDAARHSVAGGKRFRAAFCYWGFNAVADSADGPDTDPSLLRAAAALELLHASALAHDDYMDASDVRRGLPAPHRAFEALHRDHRWGGDPEQYGAAAAILLGDLLLSWSDEMLRTCGLGEDVVREALGFFDTTRSEVILGQFLDVSVQARGSSDVEEAMRVLRYKSAKYSIERPLHIGIALAGGGLDARRSLSAFGMPLGEAFQLRDDLLGVFGDPEVTGKPAGDDLREGKRTVLVAMALSRAPEADARLLHEHLGTALDHEAVARLRTIIQDSGALAEVEAKIDELTHLSLEALEEAPIRERPRQVLRALAAAATQRTV